jgi:thiamine-monophosphate kinase
VSEAEFDIIRHYFVRQYPDREDVITGIGDDAALLQAPAGMQLVAAMDTLVAGVHFPAGTPAAAIGHKALAVNLSDLAAMGAEPAWATLSLTLPSSDSTCLAEFSRGFFALADRYGVQLVGGDTCQGPLSVTVQIHGFVPPGKALLRQGARAGERIYVTGTLGDAGLALQLRDAAGQELRQRLEYPQPRIEAGLRLRDIASAAIDISDGLLPDLGHLLAAGGMGAALQIDELPRSAAFLSRLNPGEHGTPSLFYDLPLAAGDDYELCFTVPDDRSARAEECLAGLTCGCRLVGVVEAVPGIRCYGARGEIYQPAARGYQHFDGTGDG